MAPRDIVHTLQGIYKQILGREAPLHIEIDRAQRTLCLPSEDPNKLRDIICQLHKYSLKERIMFHVRGVRLWTLMEPNYPSFQTDPDAKSSPQAVTWGFTGSKLIYRWGFPFHLSVTKDGWQFILQNKDDLPWILKHLNLPTIDIPDWWSSPEIPLPSHSQPR